MYSLLLSILLAASPKITLHEDEIEAFHKLLLTIQDGNEINYNCPYPKHRFLHYLSLEGSFAFHGSNQCSIEVFEPRKQTLYNGEWTNAVFASSDPIWPIFYAIFDRKCLIGSFRNGCLVTRNDKYHYYSLNESTMQSNPWTEGKIYILPKSKFTPSGNSNPNKIRFDEWICHEPVKPLGKLSVTRDDFYFKDKVATHKDKESLLITWLFYKLRTKLANK